MSDDMVVIEAARIGLPVTASAGDIREAVYALKAERDVLRQEVEKWKDRAHELQAEAVEARKAIASNKRLEAEAYVSRIRDAKKFDKAQVENLVELYQANKDLAIRILDGMEDQSWRNTQESLQGRVLDGPADPDAEISAKAAELMASDESFRGKPAMARLEVLKRDPKLSERNRADKVAGLPKGGES